MGPIARTIVLLACAAGCGERAASDKELTDMRAEMADMRAEIRGMRQELREVREGAPAPAEGAASADAGAPSRSAEAATAAAEPTKAAAGKAAEPTPAATPAKPPPQGTVNLQIESNPPGAVVFVAGKKVGVTPLIVKTPTASEEVQVRLEKTGFRPRLMNVRPEEDTKLSVQLAKK